jgi:hypothetical protein
MVQKSPFTAFHAWHLARVLPNCGLENLQTWIASAFDSLMSHAAWCIRWFECRIWLEELGWC